jgi:SPOR domain
MFKWLIIILLGANAVLGAHLLGWIDLGLEDPRDTKKVASQLNPQAVTVSPYTPAMAKVARASAGQCLQWSALGVAEARAVQTVVSPIIAPLELSLQRKEDFTSFLVYLPPAASLANAQRRVAQLKELGVGETFVIPDGPLRWAISLGLFRSREGAQKLLSELQQKNITDVQMEPRNSAATITLKVDGLNQEQANALLALRNRGAEWAADACRLATP